MDDRDIVIQNRIHDAVEESLRELGHLKENQILTGWVICYEVDNLIDREDRFAGVFYGPREISTWRALGLVEWVSRHALNPGSDKEDDEDDH